MPDKTRSDYEARYGSVVTDQFYRYVEELKRFVDKQGWTVTMQQFNREWCSFRFAPRKVAFGITLSSTEGAHLYIKDVEAEAHGFLPSQLIRYNPVYNQVEYRLEPGTSKIEQFAPLLKRAYERRSG